MYALLEEADGRRDNDELALAMSERLGRGLDEQHVARLAEKLADQGLLAGHGAQGAAEAKPAARASLEGAGHQPGQSQGG